MDTLERRVRVERRPEDKVIFQIILKFTLTLTHPTRFTWDRVNVFDKCLHWACVNIKINNIYIYIITK
jgi:hypothetical protein